MIRNDYRRALIMMRGLKPGLSGYMRLERRTLMGTMQFTINGLTGSPALEAAVMRRQNGRWTAARLGALGLDSRGQGGAVFSFDPRNIQGAELGQYDLAVVAEPRSGGCDLLLSGYLNGSMEVDWAQVREAAASLYAGRRRPVTDLLPPQAEPAFSADVAPKATEPVSDEGEASVPETQLFETEPSAQEGETLEAEPLEDETLETEPSDLDEAEEKHPPAGQSLALDMVLPWPAQIEPLRALFEREPVFEPFPAEGYVFIRAPMPEGTGIPYCAIGIRVQGGAPTSVCYAIPGQFSIEPPVGLEDYVWRGSEGSDGYWVTCQQADTGDPIDVP